MARIRTVKPEFWAHPRTGAVDRNARLLFIGLLNEADDEGRMRYSAKRLAGVLFPFDDDVTPSLLDSWVRQLERAGSVEQYEVEGASYLVVVGFLKHQKISHSKDSALPEKPPDSFTEASVKPPVTVMEEARGEQGTGNREMEGEQGTGNAAEAALSPSEHVFAEWKDSTGKNGNTAFSTKRRRLIESALKDYPIEDLLDAVRGWSKSPFHCGNNESVKVYNSIELILRDAEHIEQFRDLWRDPPSARPITTAPSRRSTANDTQRMIDEKFGFTREDA